MSDDIFYVYVYYRPDGRPFYVGKGKGNRWKRRHRHHVANIINQGGCTCKIIYENLTEQEAHDKEVALIAIEGRLPYGPLVNLTDGGEGTSGYNRGPHSVDHKKKISLSLKGVSKPAGQGEKVSEGKIGIRLSYEHRMAISASKTGKSVNKGRTFSAETIIKMSEAGKRKIFSQAHREALKIGQANRRERKLLWQY